jgi:chromosomal replication initiation ATPase DnaA
MDMGKTFQELVEEEKARCGRAMTASRPTTNTSNQLDKGGYEAILSSISPEVLKSFPRTPEEKEAARQRLARLGWETAVCKICHDTGFVHPRRPDRTVDYSQVVSCQCVSDRIAKEKRDRLVEYCEIPKEGLHMTFENLRRYPGNQEAAEECLDMASGLHTHWITLQGRTGTGKTHLGMAVCHRWLERGQPAKYINAPMLLDE